MRTAAIVLLANLPCAAAAGSACQTLSDDAELAGWHRAYVGQISGAGRAYFHSGPDASCRAALFVIPGDSVSVYAEHGAYSLIAYSGKATDHSAWVLSSRITILARPDEQPAP